MYHRIYIMVIQLQSTPLNPKLVIEHKKEVEVLKTHNENLYVQAMLQCIPPVVHLPSFSLQLPKDQCTESFEKSILSLLNQGGQYESREVEKNLR